MDQSPVEQLLNQFLRVSARSSLTNKSVTSLDQENQFLESRIKQLQTGIHQLKQDIAETKLAISQEAADKQTGCVQLSQVQKLYGKKFHQRLASQNSYQIQNSIRHYRQSYARILELLNSSQPASSQTCAERLTLQKGRVREMNIARDILLRDQGQLYRTFSLIISFNKSSSKIILKFQNVSDKDLPLELSETSQTRSGKLGSRMQYAHELLLGETFAVQEVRWRLGQEEGVLKVPLFSIGLTQPQSLQKSKLSIRTLPFFWNQRNFGLFQTTRSANPEFVRLQDSGLAVQLTAFRDSRSCWIRKEGCWWVAGTCASEDRLKDKAFLQLLMLVFGN